MARHAFDSGDHFFVRDFVSGTHEGGIPPVHKDGSVSISVPSKSGEQFGAFRVGEGSKIHNFSPFEGGDLVVEVSSLACRNACSASNQNRTLSPTDSPARSHFQ
jgi:hypothetical protein